MCQHFHVQFIERITLPASAAIHTSVATGSHYLNVAVVGYKHFDVLKYILLSLLLRGVFF